MKKLVCALVALGLMVGVASAYNMNVYFSTSNDYSLAGIPPAASNPTVAVGQTVYVWANEVAQGGAWPQWNGVSIAFKDGVATPDGSPADPLHPVISSATFYNPQNVNADKTRWDVGSDFTATGDNEVNLLAVAGPVYGIGTRPIYYQAPYYLGEDTMARQYNPGTQTRYYLLGEMVFGSAGSIFMTVGNGGITTTTSAGPHSDQVFFGTGDAAMWDSDKYIRSAVADLTVTPEPASLILLGLAGLALRRR